MYADHLYTSMNSWSEFLTLLIYVLFIYQMFVLSLRRKKANELTDIKMAEDMEWVIADRKDS